MTILARKQAVDYIDPIEIEGETLDDEATLREALVRMLATGEERLGLSAGSISWEKILEVAGGIDEEE